MRKISALALAVPALALALASCGGSSTTGLKSLNVDATGPPLIKDQHAPVPYFVQGTGDRLLYAQRRCPPRGPALGLRYGLVEPATGATVLFKCAVGVAAGERGQLLVIPPVGRAELEAPGQPNRPVELPAHALQTAVAPDDTVFYVTDLGRGRVCIGSIAPGKRTAGSCAPVMLPSGETPGAFVVSSTGLPVLILKPTPIVVTPTGVHSLIDLEADPSASLDCDGRVAAATPNDGSVWIVCPNASDPNAVPPIRLSPGGRTLSVEPEGSFQIVSGASADAHGNVWMLAVNWGSGSTAGHTLLLRYRAAGGKPATLTASTSCDPSDLAVGPDNKLWVVVPECTFGRGGRNATPGLARLTPSAR